MEMKTIEMLRPQLPKHVDVVVSVRSEVMEHQARWFREEFLAGHPASYEISGKDLDLMAAAFLTLAGALPIQPYDLVRWLANYGMPDPAAVIHYAEDRLGMQQTDAAPWRTSRCCTAAERLRKQDRLERELAGTTVDELWDALTGYFDGDDLVAIMHRIKSEVLDQSTAMSVAA